MDHSKMIGAEEVATLLGVSVLTLKTWRRQKKNLDFYRAGRRALYLESDVAEYLARCRVKKESVSLPGGQQC